MRLPGLALMLFAACGHPTHSNGVDAPSAIDGSSGDTDGSGTADARIDTCAVPTQAFVRDAPPSSGANVNRLHARLQVPSSGPPRILAVNSYSNGSFYNELLVSMVHNATSWQTNTVFDEEWGFTLASRSATTSGDDPCVAYSQDYHGYLRLACDSLPDRVVAPLVTENLAIGRRGTTIELAYSPSVGTLVWMPYVDAPVPTETIDTGRRDIQSSVLAIGADGSTHVAYVALDAPTGPIYPRSIVHAVRRGGVWTHEVVDTDQSRGDTEGSSVSIAMIGDQPVIAYHHHGTRSLKLARGKVGGGFVLRTVVEPPMGFPNDDVGSSVVLQVDCFDRMHAVHTRSFTTDASPDHLWYAALTDTAVTETSLGPIGSPGTMANGLAFVVAADGHQYIAAEYPGSPGSYFASR